MDGICKYKQKSQNKYDGTTIKRIQSLRHAIKMTSISKIDPFGFIYYLSLPALT